MLSYVQIKDFVANETYQMVLNEDDFDEMDSIWEKEDDNLLNFKDNALFTGRQTYASLIPIHYQLLISTHIEKLDGLSLEDREVALFDDNSEIYKRLKILLMGLIKSLIATTTCYVDILNLEILSANKINFNMTLGMCIETSKSLTPEKKSALRIVVDNTKKD